MVKKKPAKKKTVRTARKTKEVEPTWDEIAKAIGKRIENSSKDDKFSCGTWSHLGRNGGGFKWAFKEKIHCGGTGGCFYFLGFIGSLVYYWTTAPTFWDAFLGFFKAIFWPAFFVYGVLKFIGV